MTPPMLGQDHRHSDGDASVSFRTLYNWKESNGGPTFDNPMADSPTQLSPSDAAGDDDWSRSAVFKFTFSLAIFAATLVAFVLVVFCYRRQRRRRARTQQILNSALQVPKEKKAEAKKRRDRILAGVTMVVEECHLVREEADDRDDLDAMECGAQNEEERQEIEGCVLSLPGIERATRHCPICLGEYQAGEEVIWSPNIDCCRNVFHKECIVGWLEKDNNECPYCREIFIPKEEDLDTNKKPTDTPQ